MANLPSFKAKANTNYSEVETLNIPLIILVFTLIYQPLFQALQLAAEATAAAEYKDWWWKVQLGKCYYRFSLFSFCWEVVLCNHKVC